MILPLSPVPTPVVASILNLAGPDLIIILLILALLGIPIGIVIVMVLTGRGAFSTRKNTSPSAPPPMVPPPVPRPASVSERLEQLNLLREKNLITQEEFEEQRRRIIREV